MSISNEPATWMIPDPKECRKMRGRKTDGKPEREFPSAEKRQQTSEHERQTDNCGRRFLVASWAAMLQFS